MRAVVLKEHGGNDKLEYDADYPTPKAGEGDVVLRVRASSLNYHDVFTRRGMPGIKIPLPVIIGLDVAGEIVEVGPGVEGWKPGDRVLVDPINRVEGGLMGETINGGLAEFCKARAHQLIRIPSGVTFEQAAALPVAYGTALRMMNTIGKIQPGEKVLILGASGGVGTCCVQLAKLVGAEVIAVTSSDDKAEKLREIGADHVVNAAKEDYVQWVVDRYGKPRTWGGSGGVDVIVNYTGGETWAQCFRALRHQGRLLTCGATAGYDPKTDIRYIWSFEFNVIGSNGWTVEDHAELLDMIAAGRLKPVIHSVRPLAELAISLRELTERKVIGKAVLTL